MSAEDCQLIRSRSLPSVLLVGPPAATFDVLKEIRGVLPRPVFSWPDDGAPWLSTREPRTLIIHDLPRVSPDDQARLLLWLEGLERRPQIVSRSIDPVFPLVQEGRFLEALYYRLNIVYVEC